MAMKRKNVPEVVPQVFEHEQFGKIRFIKKGDAIWFVAVDLCRALGYKNTRDALARHVDAEDKNTVVIRDGIPGNPNMIVVNESGMYCLIFGSKLPAAKKFTRWVTNEVLPSIRKYGYYSVTEKPAEKPLTEREKLIKKINDENPDDEIEFTGISLDTIRGKQVISYGCKLHGELAEKIWAEFLTGKTAFALMTPIK